MHSIQLISFGYLHLPTGPDGTPIPPAADRVEDVRDRLRDPAAARDILDLDGLHPRVQDVVATTPGARELLANLCEYATLPVRPRRIAIGCAGGRHLASALTELLAQALRERGYPVDVEHLHVRLPRVLDTARSQDTARPTVVVLCGSTRFWDALAEANLYETAAGRIVLAPGCDMKVAHPLWEEPGRAARLKDMLDALHRQKIALADQVLVVNPGGYIEESTRNEIAYARSLGKPIRYTHPVSEGA